MVDIPTGYFFLTVGGSGIFVIGVCILIAKLFGYKFTTQQTSGWSRVSHGDTPQSIATFQKELAKLEEGKVHYIPQAYLRVRAPLDDRTRSLVHRVGGYIASERVTGNGEYAILDVTIPNNRWDEFRGDLRTAAHVIDAYSHYGKKAGGKIK